jgi:hypothetical protein
MKKENATPVRVFRDEVHEANIKKELDSAQKALQAVLNIWNGLELIPCTDIFALILNPQKVYGEAVNQLAVVPVSAGRFQVSKEAYINTLEIPIPDSLYRICREARKFQYSNMPELWSVSGDQIVLNETEANRLIDSQSIYASGDKVKLAEDILKYIELTNKLNDKLELLFGRPCEHQMYLGKFTITQASYPGPYILELIPDKLREWLQG